MAKKKKKPLIKPAKVGPSYLRKQKGKAGWQYLTKNELKNEAEAVLLLKAKYRLAQKDPFSASMFSKDAINYFRKTIPKDTQQSNRFRSGLMKTDKYKKGFGKPGEMVLFAYNDPIWKSVLPYYDAMPLIFVINYFTSKKGDRLFNGINLHYLPPAIRYKMFLKLLEVKSGKKFSKYRKNDKLKISWQIVQSMSKSLSAAMIHSYRISQISSPIIIMPPSSWNVVAFMPIADFKKASNKTVWKDVLKK